MILGVCEDPKVLEIMRLVNIFISIIRIVVPLILIFVLMFKFLGAITKNDQDGLQKVLKILPKNLIAAIIIFLIPTIVRLVVRVSSLDNGYEKCLRVVSIEEINLAYESKIEKLIIEAEETESISNYNNASNYLRNIKDKDKRKQYEERLAVLKKKIDDAHRVVVSKSSGLGSDIVPSEELIEACKWVLNANDIQIRLSTCTDEKNRYKNPDQELPGGAIELPAGNAKAKKTISLSDYQMGVFFGEQKILIAPDSRYAFMIIYKTVLLHSAVPRAIRNHNTYGTGNEIPYVAGSCTQNYRNSQRVKKYDSGQYKAEIDDAVENTKYFVVANQDGSITDAHYHSYTGIEQAIEAAGKKGTGFVDIIEKVIGTGNDDSAYYKTARVYDCRNILNDGSGSIDHNIDISDLDINIIHTGDSRIQAYKGLKKYLGFNDNKETIFSKSATGYDKDFVLHMSSAQNKMSKEKDKTFAITVNYGVNSKRAYKSFCDYYDKFIQNMNKKNQFYIVSVNPLDENKVVSYKDDNTNAKVEVFNDYMKNTCINQIKSHSPTAKVYYCDIYGSIPLEKWASNNYVSKDGIHYTKEGSKYIYEMTKKCIASHQ